MSADVLSCPAVGDCLAAGTYNATSAPAKYFPGVHARGYLAEEVRGIWHKAVPVPGLAKLDAGGGSQVPHVACSAAATCVAAGTFYSAEDTRDGFVATELPLRRAGASAGPAS